MYAIDWTTLLARTHRNCSGCTVCPNATACAQEREAGRRWLPAVSGTVWALGFTSFFTDVSSEMVASILPMYLVLQLGLTPLAFGFVDGIYQGLAALVRVAGGVLADRWRRHKELAAAGYALSAVCRLAILAAGAAWTTLAGVVAVDRLGKGLRTAPRDALIAIRSEPRRLATAFGVHRSLDAAGAVLGPLMAFVLLARMPGAFDVLFVASFAIAIVGLAVIVLFVDPATASETSEAAAGAARGSIRDLLRDPRLRAIAIAAFLLGLPTMSDSFIYLSLQRRMQVSATAFPLFYVMTSLFMSGLSLPLGRAADRFGRRRVLVGGYVLLALVYVLAMALPVTNLALLLLPLALLGGYYAATDGVLTAMAAATLSPAAAGSGLAALATITNVARFTASVLFGLLWSWFGLAQATLTFLTVLALAIVGAALVLARGERMGRAATSGTERPLVVTTR